MQNQENATRTSDLLEEFLDSGRSEEVFARLMEEAGGLVYASAFRRTGNAQIAEEVVQNVFALLAKRAEALRNHPSLNGWIFQTTKYLSLRAMRSENRRLRKLEALANEVRADFLEDAHDPTATAEWKDAIPMLDKSLDRLSQTERELILQRFFEGMKFREIAKASGRSEGACKMGVKRALEKMSKFMAARGVSLSVAALGTYLTAELAKAIPAELLLGAAPNALAAANAPTNFTQFVNAIQTMSTLKSASITAGAVLLIAALPILNQKSKAAELERRIAELNIANPSGSPSTGAALNSTDAPNTTTTVGELLNIEDREFELDLFLSRIEEAMQMNDMLGIFRATMPVASLSSEEIDAYLLEISKRGNLASKDLAQAVLSSFGSNQNVASALDRLIESDAPAMDFAVRIYQWANSDVDAALSWFNKHRDAGTMQDARLVNPRERILLAMILGVMSRSDPDRAFQLTEAEAEVEYRDSCLKMMGRGLVGELPESLPHMTRLLSATDSPEVRKDFIDKVVASLAEVEGADNAVDYIDTLALSSSEHSKAIASVAAESANDRASFVESLEWLDKQVPKEERERAAFMFFRKVDPGNPERLEVWVDELKSNPSHDSILAYLVTIHVGRENPEQAFRRAREIADPELQKSSIKKSLDLWRGLDQGAAERAAATLVTN